MLLSSYNHRCLPIAILKFFQKIQFALKIDDIKYIPIRLLKENERKKENMGWGYGSSGKHLASKREALSSNPSTTKKQINKTQY
jgi:hypothetical protein